MTDDTKTQHKLIAFIVIVLTLMVCFALFPPDVQAENLGSKACVQFLADAREAEKANVDNGLWVGEYLKQYGLEKTDQSVWYMSILVHCITNRGDTVLDATKILVDELKSGAWN